MTSETARPDGHGPRSGAGDASSRPGPPPRVVLDSRAISRATTRIAHEILEKSESADSLALVAIASGGVPVAELLVDKLREISGAEIPLGILDVTLYRDDVIGHGRRIMRCGGHGPSHAAGDDFALAAREARHENRKYQQEWDSAHHSFSSGLILMMLPLASYRFPVPW